MAVRDFNHIPALIASMGKIGQGVTDATVDIMKEAAREAAPVMTGRLKLGIHSSTRTKGPGISEGEVTASSRDGGAEREYAAYNEYGTRYMAPQPFMKPGYVVGLTFLPVIAFDEVTVPVERIAKTGRPER